MTKFILLTCIAGLTCLPGRGDVTFPIEGSVDETCVAAIETLPLYLHTTPGRTDALACELRIRDDQGRNVPFALRQRQTRVSKSQKKWHTLLVTRVATSNSTLLVEAEMPTNAPATARWTAFDVRTPLTNFEQTVRIFADGKLVCDDTICDYGKFANFRRTEIAASLPVARRFTFVFTKPLSAAEAERFERTITERADGTIAAREIRRSIAERPFRIDALRLAEEVEVAYLKPADLASLSVPAKIERDTRAQKTRLTVVTRGLPVHMIGINTPMKNFQRTARVLRRHENGWKEIAENKLHIFSLPGENRRALSLALGSETRESLLQIEIDDGDRSPLEFDQLPVVLWTMPYEAIFIAEPNRRYSVSIEKGASRSSTDEVGLAYLASGREPVRLDYKATGSWETPVELSDYKQWNPLPLVTIIVFLILGIICFRLFRATQSGRKAE